MKNSVFIQVYKTLPRANKERSKKRDEIIKKCGITLSIFYNWKSGITPIPAEYQETISEILNIPVSKLFNENN